MSSGTFNQRAGDNLETVLSSWGGKIITHSENVKWLESQLQKKAGPYGQFCFEVVAMDTLPITS